MKGKMFFSSLTRISDLQERPFVTAPVPRDEWERGDYVVAQVPRPPPGFSLLELTTGRLVKVVEGDVIVGAFGIRHATLEVVGSWRELGDDGKMETLTAGGIIGKATSVAASLPLLLPLEYRGHATRGGQKVRMTDFAAREEKPGLDAPLLLIVGTTMSAGKTTTAKVIIRQLKAQGKRVVGCKLTGAGRYRDILGMSDAGADAVFDFVDAGLPSTVVPRDEYRTALHRVLGCIAEARPDVVVAEAGASPLEPYNGDTVVEELNSYVRGTILCASDPYAVVGVMKAFGMEPDLVAGLATSTSAGVELCEKLTGLPALNILDPASYPRLRKVLRRCLGHAVAP